MSKLFIRVLGIAAVTTISACFAYASVTSGETTSIFPSTGISASGVVSNACSGDMWRCVADPIGYPDGDTTYVHTTGASGSHVVGFSGSIGNITSVSMHIVAASNGGSGTLAMSFYNGSQPAGQGGTKIISSGSGYTEYVSGIFYTTISDISDLTLKVSLTGSVKYTAIWIDLTFGSAGTTPHLDLENYMIATGGDPSDYDWQNGWLGGSCTSHLCAGGVGPASPAVTLYATPPLSRNGDTNATKVFFSVPSGSGASGTASALEWVKMNRNSPWPPIPSLTPNPTSLTGDWWVYVSNASANNPRTLEFDLYWGNGTGQHTAMWGTHCVINRSDGVYVWELDAQDAAYEGDEWQSAIDAQTGQPIPCNLAPSEWHHIRWQVHQDPNAKDASGDVAGRIFYDYLTVDDTTYILTGASKTRGYKDPSRTQFDTMGIQAQQDLNQSSSAQVSITEYVDAMSFTYW